jgi:hypothetical protein
MPSAERKLQADESNASRFDFDCVARMFGGQNGAFMAAVLKL